MLTVYSPRRETNSLVPSSGSTSQNGPSPTVGMSPAATASSATIGQASFTSARNASRISASARWSAAVTGELSSLLSTAKSEW